MSQQLSRSPSSANNFLRLLQPTVWIRGPSSGQLLSKCSPEYCVSLVFTRTISRWPTGRFVMFPHHSVPLADFCPPVKPLDEVWPGLQYTAGLYPPEAVVLVPVHWRPARLGRLTWAGEAGPPAHQLAAHQLVLLPGEHVVTVAGAQPFAARQKIFFFNFLNNFFKRAT